MMTTMDIRHILKILLCTTILCLLFGGVASTEDEDFAIDLPPPPALDSYVTTDGSVNENLLEKKEAPRMRSPQLIPDRHVYGKGRGKKSQRSRPKRRCPTGQMWHKGSQKCVLKRCPAGSRKNSTDGECVVNENGGGLRSFSGYRYKGISWKRKQKVVYQGLPPRFGPGMGTSGRV